MERFIAALIGMLALALASDTHAAQAWTEGRNYVTLTPAQHTSVPTGKFEVVEVAPHL